MFTYRHLIIDPLTRALEKKRHSSDLPRQQKSKIHPSDHFLSQYLGVKKLTVNKGQSLCDQPVDFLI